MYKAIAVVVTYQPSRDNLLRLVDRISTQLDRVLLVDNGSTADVAKWFDHAQNNVEFISLNQNLGIAKAQNVGIDKSKQFGADCVVFFDQDSDPEETALLILISALEQLIKQGEHVACVGPRYIDTRQNNPTPFVMVKGLSLIRASCDSLSDFVPVDHLISSGSVIPMQTIEAVGSMKEELFIDYVDLEWCERAKFLGYQTYGVCAAKMKHGLGDEPISFLGTAYPARKPLRHYYMFRNAIWMYRQSYVRWNWKIVDAIRLLRKYVFYSFFAKPRHTHFWMMTKGMWHGLVGKMGSYS